MNRGLSKKLPAQIWTQTNLRVNRSAKIKITTSYQVMASISILTTNKMQVRNSKLDILIADLLLSLSRIWTTSY